MLLHTNVMIMRRTRTVAREEVKAPLVLVYFLVTC